MNHLYIITPNIIVSLGEPVLQNMNHLYIIVRISSFHWESQYYRIWITFISSSEYHRFIGRASITEYESPLYHRPNIILSLGKPVLQNMNHLYIITRISSFHWESQYYRIWITFISSSEYHPFIGKASITEDESPLYHRPNIIVSLGEPVLQNMNHLYIIVRISSFHWESQYYRIWITFISSPEYHRFIGKPSITEYESSLYHHPNIIVSLGEPVLQNMNHLYIIVRISSFHWESQYYRIWITFISSSEYHPFIGRASITEYESSLYHRPKIILSLGNPVLQNMNHLYIITRISSFHWESQYYRIWIIFISSSQNHPFIGKPSITEYESSLYHHPNIIVSLGEPVLQNMNHLYIIIRISSFHWESQYYRIWIIFISSSEYHRFIGRASITEYESPLYHHPNIILSLGEPVVKNMNHLYIIIRISSFHWESQYYRIWIIFISSPKYHRFIGKASITEYESSLYHHPNIIVSLGKPVLQNMNHLYIIVQISSFHWESQYYRIWITFISSPEYHRFIGKASITEYESSLYHRPNIIVSLGKPVLQNMNHLYIITQISSFHWESQYYRIWIIFISSSEYHRFIGKASITEYESSLYHHPNIILSLGEPVLQNMNHLYIIVPISSFHWESQYYRIWIIFISSPKYNRFIGRASITEYESPLYHHPNIIVSLGKPVLQNMNHLYIIVQISSFHWESQYYRIWIIFISSPKYHRFIGRASITEYESSLYHHPNIILSLGEPVLQNMNHLYIIVPISSFHWESQYYRIWIIFISSPKYHRFIGKASSKEYESSLYHHRPKIILSLGKPVLQNMNHLYIITRISSFHWESQYYRIWITFISSSEYHPFIGKASITEYESPLYHRPNIIVSLGEPVLQNMNHLYIITRISSFHWETQYYRIWIIFISSPEYHRFIGRASITEYESPLYHHPNIIVSLGNPVLQNMNHLYIIVRISSFHWESQYYRIWITFISSSEYHPFIGRASITEYESSLYHRPKIILSLGNPVLQNMNHLYIITRISSFHWESQYYRIWIIFISSSQNHPFIGKPSITEYESSLYHHPNIIVSLGEPVLQNMNHLYIIIRISSFHWESQYYRIWIIFISSSEYHRFIGRASITEYESPLYHRPNIILSLGKPVLQNMNHLYIIIRISSFHWESQYYRIWITFISSSEYHRFIGRASITEYESPLYHRPNIIVSLGEPVLQNMNHLYIIVRISSFHWESQYYRIWITFISSPEYHRFIGKPSITEYESSLYHRPNIILSLGKPVLQNMNHLYIIVRISSFHWESQYYRIWITFISSSEYHPFIGKASITEYESSLYHRPNIILSLGEPVLQNMNHLYIIVPKSSFHWETQYYRIWIIFISSPEYHRFIGRASITEYESSLYHHPNIIVSLGEPVLQNMNHLYIIIRISSFHWESQYYRIWIIFISSPEYHRFIGRASITEYESSLYHCPNIILSLGEPVLQNMNHLYIITKISSFHWESQ